ncbi:hypothetical protein GCM10011445_36720 [Pseudocitrobacter faecalis]|uniref:hypothetical protein n=1 Tax=Pseudocitrobacter faecalis TaxID=1398493 RepID=UPI0016755D8E|nr:hypothetical protein [Pseudocitrobacter faecalis]GHD96635.1 hypothetical protein GCM10011445_36720 [Pseudocitrobacter faecalis]
MKRCLRSLMFLVSVLTVSSPAFAECNVTVSNNNVDYGRISSNEVSQHHGDWYSLDERDVRVNAFCSEPQAMALFFSDSSGLQRFRFGDNGNLVITAQQGMLDGRRVDLGKSRTHGIFSPMGTKNRRTLLVLNDEGILPVRGGEVAIGQQFSFVLHLKPALKAGQHSSSADEELLTNLNVQLETQ